MENIPQYKGSILKLESNEVFVFGSNLDGFHGAGAAGYASFNVFGNVWREFNYQNWPNRKRGKWNVKGVGEGFQEGEIGKSYAIPTVTRAGARRSIPLSNIKDSVRKFYKFALDNAEYKFYVAQEGKIGLNGFTPEEMGKVWSLPVGKRVEFPHVYFNLNFKPYLLDY